MNYSGRSKVVVQFVKELLRLSKDVSLSITITKPEKSEVSSVLIVTDGLSVDTVERMAQSYSKLRSSISPESTQAG